MPPPSELHLNRETFKEPEEERDVPDKIMDVLYLFKDLIMNASTRCDLFGEPVRLRYKGKTTI
jgi:hypothetical protein